MGIKRWISSILAAVIVVGSVAGTSVPVMAENASAEEEIVLRVQTFGTDVTKALDEETAERFMKEHPNVKVEMQLVSFNSWAEYLQILLANVAAGSPPDALVMAIEGVQLTAFQDVVLPLEQFMENDPDFDIDHYADVPDSVFNSLKYKDELYFLPVSFNEKVLCYNKAVFDKAGIPYPSEEWTWDDFMEACKQLTSGSGDDKVYGCALQFQIWVWGMFAHLFGTSLLNEDWTQSNLDDPKVEEAFQYIYDMVNTYGVCPMPEMNMPEVIDLMSSGRVAMMIEGEPVLENVVNSKNEDFGITLMPQATDGSGEHRSVFGSVGVGVTAASEHKELAWELVKMMCDDERSSGIPMVYNGVPAKKSLAEEVFAVGNMPEYWPENSILFWTNVENSVGFPCPVNFGEFDTIIADCVASFLADEQSVHDALAEAHQRLQESFADTFE